MFKLTSILIQAHPCLVHRRQERPVDPAIHLVVQLQENSSSSSIAALSTPSINTNRTKLAYTQKKPWDQFTLNIWTTRIHLGVGCRGGGEGLLPYLFAALCYHHSPDVTYVENQGVGISIQFCRVPHQNVALIDIQWLNDCSSVERSSSSSAEQRQRCSRSNSITITVTTVRVPVSWGSRLYGLSTCAAKSSRTEAFGPSGAIFCGSQLNELQLDEQ